MVEKYIKGNRLLHPIARCIKKFTIFIWAKICQCKLQTERVNIEKYKNIHKGKRCFIVATGPSLTLKDLEMLNGEITFSMNSIINLYDKTTFRPNYYLIQDGNVERRLHEKLKVVKHDASFIGISDITGFNAIISKKQAKSYKDKFEFYTLRIAYHMFDMCYGAVDDLKIRFSEDCAKEVFDGCTVTYSAIQLACYMGFNEIYLLGCDTNFSGHVDGTPAEPGKKAHEPAFASIKAYQRAKQYADEHDIRIYNATRGGMLEVFPRVDFDQLFSKHT